MNTRQTSINCYNEIKLEGLLSKRRMEVYEAIYNSAPCTSAEAMMSILRESGDVLSQSRARFTELRELGVIFEKGEKVCSMTGRTVIEWDLTDRLPVKVKHSFNAKKQRINNALDSLRELYKNKNTCLDEDWVKVADLINNI